MGASDTLLRPRLWQPSGLHLYPQQSGCGVATSAGYVGQGRGLAVVLRGWASNPCCRVADEDDGSSIILLNEVRIEEKSEVRWQRRSLPEFGLRQAPSL
jgi:hypothetical protein